MPTNPPLTLDATDHAIIAELQGDGRTRVAQLGRAVSAH
ncbi:AsnC family transcriptional regulator [Clavibacter michiganensis]|nr:AsnC family transcriptional regulator [Clavibacter michiganensis]